MDFKLSSEFRPTGDQPQAIKELVEGAKRGDTHQVLLGVTGSGKTFTIANVIEKLNRPALVLSHNKTLAAQLYGEFKQFFPENAVEYFVSYYDYYQPEAYIPTTNTYIEKDLSINDEIEKLRLSTTSSLLSGRRDVLVVSSVSCLYGMGNPQDYYNNVVTVKKGESISRNKFLHQLVSALYSRTEGEFTHGTFRVKGDTVDVFLAYRDFAYRITFFGDEIEEVEAFDPISGVRYEHLDEVRISPANLFVTTKESMKEAIFRIQDDLTAQIEFLKDLGKHIEAKRLEDRVTYDMEMMRELGYCAGIENYSRYFDGRPAGMRPFCLLDYFPQDFLLIIDESHATIPQIRAMYGGDRSRKINLVEYGFRLPAALDNRPLTFDEFDSFHNQTIYISATPADFELQRAGGVVVEQLIRPTGLLDPPIEVRPTANQVDDLMEEISIYIKNEHRILVTTLTKRMAEELTKYLTRIGIRCRYIHSDVDTLERVEILRDLRLGLFDVLIGVNLLREGLDLPEVALVAILDADKEGFLRSGRSLTQTAGRAARNVNGKVIMYADKITAAMRQTIDETERRRAKQQAYNEEHGIVPTQIVRSKQSILGQSAVAGNGNKNEGAAKFYVEPEDNLSLAADPVEQYMSREQLERALRDARKQMEKSARDLDFVQAARYRDEMYRIEKLISDQA
ncbi:MAG: excinuclease subunit UvrB [Bacteroidota bacterium]|jgi:excinuclease ABC subunit B